MSNLDEIWKKTTDFIVRDGYSDIPALERYHPVKDPDLFEGSVVIKTDSNNVEYLTLQFRGNWPPKSRNLIKVLDFYQHPYSTNPPTGNHPTYLKAQWDPKFDNRNMVSNPLVIDQWKLQSYEIHVAAGSTAQKPLFDSVIKWENWPESEDAVPESGGRSGWTWPG